MVSEGIGIFFLITIPLNTALRLAMSHLMLKSAKRASLIENLRSLRGFDKMLVR